MACSIERAHYLLSFIMVVLGYVDCIQLVCKLIKLNTRKNLLHETLKSLSNPKVYTQCFKMCWYTINKTIRHVQC